MTRYLLAPQYRLRGWKRLPCALFDSEEYRVTFFRKEPYSLLMRCDGMQEIDRDALTDDQITLLDALVDRGILSECGPGSMLEPLQLYKLYPHAYRRVVHWGITGRCNFRCKHCLVSAPHAKWGHPTTEQLLKLIEQMAECGIAHVSLTGGEPLIRSDFWQIVDALLAHDIVTDMVFTNGYLVNDALLDGFEARGMHPSFQMSYDGVGWHDWLRGFEGQRRPLTAPSPSCRSEASMRTLPCACTEATPTPSARRCCTWRSSA